ncbi:hypothetical protein K458DRAFT_367273 [Lentithecium fluviatile CBS 122367]|uniref:Spindle pole body component n=1 Tax=Lentithecium fluviatile CBS 122367 TaxID=1168545 RepID=A0A6G1J0X6_9PLEO|nr:hypothetical protein K458DRAFT_367273 [Lentithecium fluviatile CBS 122367]
MDPDTHDAFASNRLWATSAFADDPSDYASSLFAPLQLDVPAIKLDHPYAPKDTLDRELRLPGIDAFAFGPLPELDRLDASSVSLDTPPTDIEEDDVWQAALELGPADKDRAFFTWETSEQPGRVERQTPYITETGPRTFDAALAKDDATTVAGKVVKGKVLVESLWNLGLGRSSILFSFNPKRRSFEPLISAARTSGFSLRAAQSIITQFVHTGNTVLYLRSFVERTFASANSIPARVALATSVSSIISTFEDHLYRQSTNIRSLLELQRLFDRPREILNYIARTVDAVKHANTNEQLSSILHHRILDCEEGDSDIRRLLCEILTRVAKPSLDLVGEWIGIQEEQTVAFHERGSFVAIDDSSERQGPPEYVYHSGMMPRYITTEDGNSIFETGNSLRFLKMHHPEHPLAASRKFAVRPPALEWKFGWQDIEAISHKAKAYEDELRAATLRFSRGERPAPLEDTSSSASTHEGAAEGTELIEGFEESARLFDAPPQPSFGALSDGLQTLTEQILANSSSASSTTSSMFSPPLPLTSTLSFRPLLRAQANLVNATTLRLFLRSHRLRLHLSLQRQYQLFGDGVFSTRLASALFDPERESAEHQKGKMRSGVRMGLQLGSRDSWPPASSELRLALMGVLNESYYSSALYYSTRKEGTRTAQRDDKDELPGQLNFAVRQLTEPEMEKVMDPYALYALDFLRLQYVPPSPLNLVITTAALDKYDQIFKFLLRLQRMIFVVAHLPRQYPDAESCHLRMEAHHFVTSLSQYIFQTGIAEHWDAFDLYVSTVEHRLSEEDAADELGTLIIEGLASLRTAHEECLDSILFSLLLRRRQRKVMALMEEIFELVLLFAKKQNPDTQVEDSLRDLYDKLKGKIKVFLSVCRQLTGKKGYGKGRGTAEENTLERLNVLLEMNGYFAKGST